MRTSTSLLKRRSTLRHPSEKNILGGDIRGLGHLESDHTEGNLIVLKLTLQCIQTTLAHGNQLHFVL